MDDLFGMFKTIKRGARLIKALEIIKASIIAATLILTVMQTVCLCKESKKLI